MPYAISMYIYQCGTIYARFLQRLSRRTQTALAKATGGINYIVLTNAAYRVSIDIFPHIFIISLSG